MIEDTASNGKQQRSGLERAHEPLRKSDVLVVWRLDWLGHTLKHLIELRRSWGGRASGFRRRSGSARGRHPRPASTPPIGPQ
ncbi:recombinase family protein [Singulisphaera acidiphila]|uniref:recombinase family protein n=1 Tax=Singulisphaera acidiphila TaxID=466153 RepID=UPI0009D94451